MRADGKSGDAELVRRILDGDERAFSALCAKYEARLHSYVLKRVHNREDAKNCPKCLPQSSPVSERPRATGKVVELDVLNSLSTDCRQGARAPRRHWIRVI